MGNWKHTLRIKHLMTEDETPEAVSKSMKAIALAVCARGFMADFESRHDMAECTDVDEANYLLDSLYDYCDSRRIWVQ